MSKEEVKNVCVCVCLCVCGGGGGGGSSGVIQQAHSLI